MVHGVHLVDIYPAYFLNGSSKAYRVLSGKAVVFMKTLT